VIGNLETLGEPDSMSVVILSLTVFGIEVELANVRFFENYTAMCLEKAHYLFLNFVAAKLNICKVHFE